MAFWNKTNEKKINNGSSFFKPWESAGKNNLYSSDFFVRRIIRDALSLDYSGIGDLKGVLFSSFISTQQVNSFNELLLYLLGKQEFFSIVDKNNVSTLEPNYYRHHMSENKILGFHKGKLDNNDNQSIYVDYTSFSIPELDESCSGLRSLSESFYYALQISNKPILKIYNGAEKIEDLTVFDKMLKKVMDGLYNLSNGSNTSIAYMGDKDSLELLLPDFQQYATGMDLCFTKIAMCTGFPLSYIKGIGVGGLNADGSGERVQTDLALYSFAKQYIVPLLQEILNRYGIKEEVNVKKPVSIALDRAKALGEGIQAIEFTNLLTDEQKKPYIVDLM